MILTTNKSESNIIDLNISNIEHHDLCKLDLIMSKILYKLIIEYRNLVYMNKNSIPTPLMIKYEIPEIAHLHWMDIIDNILKAFEIINAQLPYSKKDLIIISEGLELFSKYFTYFWKREIE